MRKHSLPREAKYTESRLLKLYQDHGLFTLGYPE